MGGKFLGIGYCPIKDEIQLAINPHIRVSKGKKGRSDAYMEANQEVLQNVLEGVEDLTKRSVTSFMAAQYDPHWSLGPILLTGKLLLRKLHGKDCKLDWDEPLPVERRREWNVLCLVCRASCTRCS